MLCFMIYGFYVNVELRFYYAYFSPLAFAFVIALLLGVVYLLKDGFLFGLNMRIKLFC